MRARVASAEMAKGALRLVPENSATLLVLWWPKELARLRAHLHGDTRAS
jgi:hypothetical protein